MLAEELGQAACLRFPQGGWSRIGAAEPASPALGLDTRSCPLFLLRECWVGGKWDLWGPPGWGRGEKSIKARDEKLPRRIPGDERAVLEQDAAVRAGSRHRCGCWDLCLGEVWARGDAGVSRSQLIPCATELSRAF